jgi:uncharacterized protein
MPAPQDRDRDGRADRVIAERAAAGLVDRIIQLSRALQARGMSISLAETIDATDAAATVRIDHRDELRIALRSTLVKQPDARGDFDALFERLFPARTTAPATARPDVSTREHLAHAVVGGDDLADIAAALVDEHGGLGEEQRSARHHVQRVLRAADLARLLSLAVAADAGIAPDELRARLDDLKRLIADEVRSRLATPDEPPPEDVEDIEFLNASRAQLEEMRRIVRPLARRVAARLARNRRHGHAGRVDMRRTIRRSLGTGGVPFDVAFRRRRPHRAELFVLCDISGSVAEFSLFTLTLMSALSAEIPRTRTFVFVDAVDEVTALLARTGHAIEPWQIMRNTNVIGATGHSDYGAVLEQFWHAVGEQELTLTSTVLIAGDARSNHQPARPEILGRIAHRTRAIYWLNPEPARDWDRFDSDMAAYGRHCTRTFEVRDLQQLVRCVELIL